MKTIRVCVVSEDEERAADLVETCTDLGVRAEVCTERRIRAANPARHALLWLVAEPQPHPSELSPVVTAAVERFLAAGRGVFAEFVRGFPGAGETVGLRKTGPARLFVTEALEGGPGVDAILDAHDTVTVETRLGSGRMLAGLGTVRGVRRVLTPAADAWSGIEIGESGPGRWAWSAVRISDYRRRELSPLADWALLLAALLRSLLPPAERRQVAEYRIPIDAYGEPRAWCMPGEVLLVVRTAPGAQVTSGKLAFTEEAPGSFVASVSAARPGEARWRVRVACGDRRNGGRSRDATVRIRVEGRCKAYGRALGRNMRWFERSGVMLASDGSLGLTEWISGPDGEGNRIPSGQGQVLAPDRTLCMFQSGLAFLSYGSLARSHRHAEVARNLLWRAMDFQRLEAGDELAGLWHTRGRAGRPYEDDEAWAVMCVLASHRLSGDPMLLERGLLGARATVRVFGPKAPVTAAAADRGQMCSAWLYAYGTTGDASFRDLALSSVTRMIGTLARPDRHVVSRTSEMSRWLLPLAMAYAYTRDPLYATEIAATADYLRSRRAPCGAMQEQIGDTADAVDGGDRGLSCDGTEPVTDQLFTTGWAAMNLWIAHRATGEAVYRDDFEKLMDYLVRIQLESADPRLDGGWTRAFDYELWEPHASNADRLRTAWCLGTGWANAIIDIALALYLSDDSFLPHRDS